MKIHSMLGEVPPKRDSSYPPGNQSFVRKLVSAAFGIFIVFAAIEIGIRMFSKFAIPTDQSKNSIDNGRQPRSGELRIVTIGESTTAPTDIAGVRVDWPFQLRKRLESELPWKDSFQTIRVYNLGVPATTTPFLMKIFMNRLDEIDPDVVVAMMGVNDNIPMAVKRGAFYESSRAVRFFLWAFQYRNCSECFDGTWPQPREKEDRRLYTEDPAADAFAKVIGRKQVTNLKSYEEFVAIQNEYLEQHTVDSILSSAALATRLLEILIDTGNVGKVELLRRVSEDARVASKAAMQMAHKDTTVVHTFCHLSAIANRRDCSHAILEAMKRGLRPTYSILSIGINYGGHEDPAFVEMMKSLGFEIDFNSNAFREVSAAYRRLAELAKQKKFLFLAMQYPGGTRDGIAAYFHEDLAHRFKGIAGAYSYHHISTPLDLPEKYRHAVLVDNVTFKSIVTPENASEYFTDFFARYSGMNFGHATAKGNAIIVDNVRDAIKENLSKIERVHRDRSHEL